MYPHFLDAFYPVAIQSLNFLAGLIALSLLATLIFSGKVIDTQYGPNDERMQVYKAWAAFFIALIGCALSMLLATLAGQEAAGGGGQRGGVDLNDFGKSHAAYAFFHVLAWLAYLVGLALLGNGVYMRIERTKPQAPQDEKGA